MTTEPNNVKKLQQRNYNLVVENEFLKDENNRHNEFCTYWENEHDKLLDEKEELKEKVDNLKQDLQDISDRCIELYNKNEQLKQENTQLKHKNKAQAKTIDRLINIITDEHYN